MYKWQRREHSIAQTPVGNSDTVRMFERARVKAKKKKRDYAGREGYTHIMTELTSFKCPSLNSLTPYQKVIAKSPYTAKKSGAICIPNKGESLKPLRLASSIHFEYDSATRFSAPHATTMRIELKTSLAIDVAFSFACSKLF